MPPAAAKRERLDTTISCAPRSRSTRAADDSIFDSFEPQLEARVTYRARAKFATLRAWLITALSFAVAVAAPSQSARAQAEPSLTSPGQTMWETLPSPQSEDSMVVNLRTQRAYVYRGGVIIGSTRISSGKPGYRTPTGTFTVLEKEKMHHSNRYDNAPMPYMQRLTWYGVALHAGHVPLYPASHGCVRMPPAFARWLFGEPTMGMTVVITDQSQPEESVANAGGAGTSTDADNDETDSSH
jgi:lipoprotein-anchoring transpeptidase ErfK/SrfK